MTDTPNTPQSSAETRAPLELAERPVDQCHDQDSVKLSDLVGFWFGYQRSIAAVLQTKSTLWLGALLVFTAAMGREYDAVSLLHRPWELLGSFAASIVMCTILFGFIYLCLGCVKRTEANPSQEYLTFLGAYWMTAPLAWPYAFPIETLTDELTSVHFNLTVLSVVSIWRVLLFARIVAIQFALPYLSSLTWVLVPCMVVAFGALVSAILPMVSIMGGIRLTRTQQVVINYQSGLLMTIFYAAIPVLICLLVSFAYTDRLRPARPEVLRSTRKLSRGPWLLALSALGLSVVWAVPFQISYWQAAEIDRLIVGGRIPEALERLEANGPAAPPATWDPLPRLRHKGSKQVDLALMIDELSQRKAATWLNDLMLEQAEEMLLEQAGLNYGTEDLEFLRLQLSSLDLPVLVRLEQTFSQLAGVGRREVTEQRRVGELHQLIVQAIEEKHRLSN